MKGEGGKRDDRARVPAICSHYTWATGTIHNYKQMRSVNRRRKTSAFSAHECHKLRPQRAWLFCNCCWLSAVVDELWRVRISALNFFKVDVLRVLLFLNHAKSLQSIGTRAIWICVQKFRYYLPRLWARKQPTNTRWVCIIVFVDEKCCVTFLFLLSVSLVRASWRTAFCGACVVEAQWRWNICIRHSTIARTSSPYTGSIVLCRVQTGASVDFNANAMFCVVLDVFGLQLPVFMLLAVMLCVFFSR